MVKLSDPIHLFWIDFWYATPWFKTGPKLLGLFRPEKHDDTTAELFFLACEQVKKLREKLKKPYESPLSLNAHSIASIIDLHAQTVCFRTLAHHGPHAGSQTLEEAILGHEEILKELEGEPKSSVQAIQVAMSKAIIYQGSKLILQFKPKKM